MIVNDINLNKNAISDILMQFDVRRRFYVFDILSRSFTVLAALGKRDVFSFQIMGEAK